MAELKQLICMVWVSMQSLASAIVVQYVHDDREWQLDDTFSWNSVKLHTVIVDSDGIV